MTDGVAKVLHQTEKVKGKWQERKRRGPAARSVKTPRARARPPRKAARDGGVRPATRASERAAPHAAVAQRKPRVD